MSSTQNVSKLAELHFKTDRQLAEMIGRSLENGLLLAQAAGSQCRSGDRATAAQFVARAGGYREQAERLLPAIQVADLRTPLEEKREALRNKLATLIENCGPTACC